MTLIACPDCGNQVSDAAPACLRCGRPINVRKPVPSPLAPTLLVGALLGCGSCAAFVVGWQPEGLDRVIGPLLGAMIATAATWALFLRGRNEVAALSALFVLVAFAGWFVAMVGAGAAFLYVYVRSGLWAIGMH